jgi:V8-like Glu-specific endopeptidase
MKNSKLHSIIVTGMVMALPVLALSVQAAPLTVTKSASKQAQAAASTYWTPERIRSAPAFPMPVDSGAGGVDASAIDEGAPTGSPSSSPPGEPVANLSADWEDALSVVVDEGLAFDEGLALDEGVGAAGGIPTGTPGTYTYYGANTNSTAWKIYPHIWDGKLTFNVPGGTASCSATAISNNHFVTAAHCVYDTTNNLWYSNWVFTPAYRLGVAPYGTFPYRSCTILTAWVNLAGAFSINSWTRHDVAVCGVGTNASGQTLNSRVGWAGRLWDAAYAQLNFNSGYPARDYNLTPIGSPAQYLRSCTNESFQQTTETLGGGCFWASGISGGSWLIDYKPFVANGWVNSVNSGLFIGQQNLYGARFNSSNIVPLCNAEGC